MNKPKNRTGGGILAFTLAEVLITLVIIGIISAITVPTLNQQYKWQQYKSAAKKAQSMLGQAVLKFQYNEGFVPRCGYSPNDDSIKDDCEKIYDSFLKNLNIQKVCDENAYDNGCIPKYEGLEGLFLSKNPDASQEEIDEVYTGLSGFKQNNIMSGKAFITGDGMILFPYNDFRIPIISVDLNGQKGPNRWGTDVHTFALRMKNEKSPPEVTIFAHGYIMQSGGRTLKSILYSK